MACYDNAGTSRRRVVWVGGSNAGGEQRPSYSVHFTDIMMHAVASPSDAFAQHSIYMQLDGAQSADDEDGDAAAPEVRLAPADPAHSASCCLLLGLHLQALLIVMVHILCTVQSWACALS